MVEFQGGYWLATKDLCCAYNIITYMYKGDEISKRIHLTCSRQVAAVRMSDHYRLYMLYIALAKQGDNALGSVRLSVRLHALSCLTYNLDF